MVKAAAAVLQGPELDGFIHWLVFDNTVRHAWGWPSDEGIRTCAWCGARSPGGGPTTTCTAVPPFSSSMKAAILVMTELHLVLQQGPRGRWLATCLGNGTTGQAASHSAPLAICQAAIESLN